ncbi:MAG: hypothetical protein KatS3mg032_2176 [Cyclobacteriaceae bacterium]|nr:MAG: hypothetical protein KatS3mg032_2176 [Cyclobacteriaceae bacterium]
MNLFKCNPMLLKATTCLAFGILLSSCSKDEEGIPNRLTINGTNYVLSNGYISGNGVFEDDNGNRGSVYQVILATSGVTITDGDLAGTGQLFYMALFSPSTVELAAGTYAYDERFLEGNLLEAAGADGNFTTGVGSEYGITSGTVTISKSGNTWTFQFEGEADDGAGGTIAISGSFSGPLTEIEF